jgi:ADP-heptose:LPS heptosyltransferase
MRIAVYRPGALGDTLLTFPALAVLREQWPDAPITLICRTDVHPLTSGLADTTYSHDLAAWACLYADGATPSKLAREVFAGVDLAVVWAPDAQGKIAARLRAVGAREALVAAPPPQAGSSRHAALQLLDTLAPLGYAAPATLAALSARLPTLRWPEAAEAEALRAWSQTKGADADRSPVAIHPGSGGARKRWPRGHFAALIHTLRRACAPILIAGPQDEEILAQVVAEAGTTPAVRNLSVAGLAALLSHCALYIGNDSGVTHLAGMLGVPTIALFGPTEPALWRPLGPRVITLRSPTGRMEDLPPGAAIKAIQRLMGGT